MLHVHRAERTTELVAGLARVLADAPADPFAPDIVAVPTKGVERWLAQRLSHVLGATGGDGVCANVDFPSPGALLARALSAGSGVDPDDDPWEPARSTWRLLPVIDAAIREPWCATLAAHLAGADERAPGRRIVTAQRLARLFHAYALSRPQLLRDWVAGDDTDGAGGRVPDDLDWQPELFRRLRAEIGAESPAERLPRACEVLRRGSAVVDLPERFSIFGPTRINAAQLDALAALADHRDVHLWLPHPSPALWQSLATHDVAAPRRRDHVITVERGNPLLASLGRDARELQLRLARTAPDHTDEHLAAEEQLPSTLLGRLQRAIVTDEAPQAATAASGDDRSLQVHACHGAARQVEVLREVLVGMLADDPSLEPRDVLVMCPHVEDYAPLISAAFGLVPDDAADGGLHPGHRLRVRLADRSLRQTNPVLGMVAALLDLAADRVTATQVLDFAALAPVRRKFRFDDDELERLTDWAVAAGVRWGLDAAHRAAYHLGSIEQNTWQAGIDRILLGAAMAEDGLRWVDRVLPLDDVDSSDVDLAGRLAELLSRVHTVIRSLTGAHELTAWVGSLTEALGLLAEVGESDAWQLAQAQREIAELAGDAGDQARSTTLGLGDVRALLADRLAGRPTRANFRTGHLTMCSMLPMRSVPHRVICLLGLDDGAFPRGSGVDGDDVLARDPCLGERDPRSEDRQLLLDAILAAREHLVILYTGADPRTNDRRPPAVPVGEILDAVDAIATAPDGRRARTHVVVEHPLQPFDARNFERGGLGARGRPFSFDRVALGGARAAASERHDSVPLVAERLPEPAETADVLLDDLIRFLEHPAKAFLRQRLGVTLLGDEGEIDESIPLELAGLARFHVGDRIVEQVLAGHGIDRATGAEWRRGTLPPQRLGKRALDVLTDEVRAIRDACGQVAAEEGASTDLVVELRGGRLTGSVPGVRANTVLRATFASLSAKHRLRAWVQLLALTVALPGRPWTAVTVGRGDGAPARSVLGPIDAGDARQWLDELVALYRDGLCRPAPMPPKTAAIYAGRRPKSSEYAARRFAAFREWESRFGERDDAWQQLFGAEVTLEELCAEPAESDRGEGTRFGELARLVWDPLLAAERAGGAR